MNRMIVFLLTAVLFLAQSQMFAVRNAGAAGRISCGTAWTGWIDTPAADVNPCPKGCVRGEQQVVTPYKSGGTVQYNVRYQCYQAEPATSMTPPGKPLSKAPAASLLKPAAPVGTLTPTRGPWHTFVKITGDKMGTTISAKTVWYPNDDDSQPPLGTLTTTLRGAHPQTGAEIEIPADAGGPNGGVVRIMLTVPGEKEPLFAGRFTVDNTLALKLAKTQPGKIAPKPIDTKTVTQPGHHTFTLAGFTASGVPLVTPAHDFVLVGFTGTGMPVGIASHDFTLAGFTASGIPPTIFSHDFALAGFTGSGIPVGIASHDFTLAGFTASGIPPAIVSHHFQLAGWTGLGSTNIFIRRIK